MLEFSHMMAWLPKGLVAKKEAMKKQFDGKLNSLFAAVRK